MASDKGKKSAKTVTAIPANDDGTEKRALDIALAGIEKQFGKGAVIRIGERAVRDIQVIPTGCLDLDMALGVGGMPRGRVVEIYGPESSGKTTVALHIVAEAQKMGGVAAFIDAEHALDPVYARKLGVDVDPLYVSSRTPASKRWKSARRWFTARLTSWSSTSVAALVPKAEIDGEMGDTFVGLQARLMSQALRKLTGIINKTNSTCIFINQLREKVGVMYGNPETTPGGRALKFYASVRIDIRRGEQLKDGTTVVGNRTKAKIVKNKVAPPSEPRSSIFSTARASARKAACWTARLRWISSTNPARGSPTATSASARAARTPASSSGEKRGIAAEIDKPVRAELMGKDAPVAERGG